MTDQTESGNLVFPSNPLANRNRAFRRPIPCNVSVPDLKVCLRTEILVFRGEIKGSETFFRLILSEKNDSKRKRYTSFPFGGAKMLFFTPSMKFPSIYSNLEPGAGARLKLAHADYVFPL